MREIKISRKALAVATGLLATSLLAVGGVAQAADGKHKPKHKPKPCATVTVTVTATPRSVYTGKPRPTYTYGTYTPSPDETTGIPPRFTYTK